MTRTPVSQIIIPKHQNLISEISDIALGLEGGTWDNDSFERWNRYVYKIYDLSYSEVELINNFYELNATKVRRFMEVCTKAA